MAQIVGIALKEGKRTAMKTLPSVDITIENGLQGDFRGKGGIARGRQVTVLSLQQWEQVCGELGVSLPWHTRRANLCVDGLTFGPNDLGKRLCVGKRLSWKLLVKLRPVNEWTKPISALRTLFL